jgi:uncharacterized membrane protein
LWQDARVPGELHPFVLHFAVALLLMGPLLDVLGLLLRREALLHAGRWNTIVGALAGVVTLLTGLGAQAALPPHSAAGEALLHLHQALGIVTVLIWLPIAGWRIGSRLPLPLRARTLYLAAAISAAVLLTAETILGSAMVYRHGVGLSPSARAEPMVRAPAKPR